jgi:hypothetical protein
MDVRMLTVGLGKSKIIAHVLSHRAAGMVLGPGSVRLGFFVSGCEGVGTGTGPPRLGP